MNKKHAEEKFDELEGEMIDIIDIVELLDIMCDCEHVDNYAHKLYILVNLLKKKCIKLDDMHYQLNYILDK